jgi:hypothetical protein
MKNCMSPVVIDLGWAVKFQKDPPTNSKLMTCVEFARADGVSVAHNHVFSNRLVRRGRCGSSAACFHHGTCLCSTVKFDTKNGQWRFES